MVHRHVAAVIHIRACRSWFHETSAALTKPARIIETHSVENWNWSVVRHVAKE
jgi:hypothetical protein